MKAYPFSLPLLKNDRYPTFQLFATMDNRKTSPRDGLKLGAWTALHWLAGRLGPDVPAPLRDLPPLENFREVGTESLKSFHLSAGFNVSVLAMPDQGIWTMQITEPDLGSDPNNPDQKRKPFPGRVFETNVGFQVSGSDLKCGFQTIVTEPSGADPVPEVYRLAIVRALIENPDFGLRQIERIVKDPLSLKTGVDLDRFLSLRRSAENQLPLLVFVLGSSSSQPDWRDLLSIAPKETPEKKLSIHSVEIARPKREDFLGQVKLPESFGPRASVLSKELRTPEKISPLTNVSSVKNDEKTTTARSALEERTMEEARFFAAHLWSFGLTYLSEASLCEKLARTLNRSLESGDVLLCEPIGFGGSVSVVSGKLVGAEREAELKKLRQFVHDYARRRAVLFPGISFLSAAREQLTASVEEALENATADSQESAAEIQKLRAHFNEELDRRDGEITERGEQLAKLRGVLSARETDIEKLRTTFDDLKEAHAAALAEKDDLINYLRDRMTWPESHAEIANWAEDKLKGKLVLVQHAKDLLLEKGAQSADVGLICEALHFLATDYRDARYKFITEEERDLRAYAKYGRGFQIAPTSDATIRLHPEQYRVKYSCEGNKNSVDCDLTSHLRVGTGAAHLLRIYFFHDDERKLIVVGSLPQHLKNADE